MIGDSLAVGASIAIFCRSQSLTVNGLVWVGAIAVCVPGLALIVLSNMGYSLKGDTLGSSVGYSMMEWFTGGVLILMLCAYRTRPIPKGLGFLLFFGKISYGLYLIHMLCEIYYDRLAGNSYLTNMGALFFRFALVNGLAVLLAALSKRYFENPILRLREKIPSVR
jgi:peptidoglycan/LPS O-acetylase OafA/YrhL